MLSMLKKPYQWMGNSINSPYADIILTILFYVEAIFFLPTDPILILYCLENRPKAIWYATISLIGSVLGGMTSYAIGYVLWDWYGQEIIHSHLVNYFLSPSQFFKIAANYEYYEWTYVFIAGFTPVPYKLATLVAGFCKISFVPFVLCSIAARGARFYLLAIICKVWGDRIKDSVHKYFNVIMLLTVVLIVLFTWLFT